MSLLNQTVLYGSLSTSEKTLEGNHTDKTETDDATYDFRVLSFKKVFEPGTVHQLRVNEFVNKLFLYDYL